MLSAYDLELIQEKLDLEYKLEISVEKNGGYLAVLSHAKHDMIGASAPSLEEVLYDLNQACDN